MFFFCLTQLTRSILCSGWGRFLLAHVFYCIYFAGAYRKIAAASGLSVLLLVAVYGGLLLYILSPYLGALVWPVRVYALVISVMLLLALYVHVSYHNRASMLLALGACFFIISDSVLAINKFYAAFPFAGVVVMSTYGVAQAFIVSGALRLPIKE
ncbi:MAG: lysoplasmalogenase [Chitinophagaceae bacterium]|nr:lysoplasmalogenase [Chitinophagaceae bacterium]